MLKFCNVSDIAQYGPKNVIFVEGKLIREGFTKRLRKKSGDLPNLPRDTRFFLWNLPLIAPILTLHEEPVSTAW